MTFPPSTSHPGPAIPKYAALVLSVAVCFAAAILGSLLTTPNIVGWYATLAKPVFNPPNWIFAPVWTVLYAMMAVAAWRVWVHGVGVERRRALIAFAVQLVLNVAWSAAFFAGHSPSAGLVVILALLVMILVTTARFGRIDPLAAWLFAPYIAWVGFASVLNLAILILN